MSRWVMVIKSVIAGQGGREGRHDGGGRSYLHCHDALSRLNVPLFRIIRVESICLSVLHKELSSVVFVRPYTCHKRSDKYILQERTRRRRRETNILVTHENLDRSRPMSGKRSNRA